MRQYKILYIQNESGEIINNYFFHIIVTRIYRQSTVQDTMANADQEWITLLSTTNNRKITQRGRYLEVNLLIRVRMSNLLIF